MTKDIMILDLVNLVNEMESEELLAYARAMREYELSLLTEDTLEQLYNDLMN